MAIGLCPRKYCINQKKVSSSRNILNSGGTFSWECCWELSPTAPLDCEDENLAPESSGGGKKEEKNHHMTYDISTTKENDTRNSTLHSYLERAAAGHPVGRAFVGLTAGRQMGGKLFRKHLRKHKGICHYVYSQQHFSNHARIREANTNTKLFTTHTSTTQLPGRCVCRMGRLTVL